MDLKQKVKAILICIISVIVLSAGGYFVYFIISDTLKPPPEYKSTENLFVAKIQKDIELLGNSESVFSINIANFLKKDSKTMTLNEIDAEIRKYTITAKGNDKTELNLFGNFLEILKRQPMDKTKLDNFKSTNKLNLNYEYVKFLNYLIDNWSTISTTIIKGIANITLGRIEEMYGFIPHETPHQINIETPKKKETIYWCKKLYDNISLSLKEDSINQFLGKSAEENENMYKSLWKKLNYTYIEQFICLTDEHFEKPEWKNDDNNFVDKVVAEIKNTGFVEYNTPIWNVLTGYEKNISCYREMKDLISYTNHIISYSLNNNFPNSNIEYIKAQKQYLINRNDCKKNSNKLNELNTCYEKLKNKSYDYLSSKIEKRIEKFNENRPFYEKDYEKQYYIDNFLNDIEMEVTQWDNIFYRNKNLHDKLVILRKNINAY